MSFLNNAGVTTLWSRIKAYLTGAHVKTTAVSGATNVDDALTSIGGALSTQSDQIVALGPYNGLDSDSTAAALSAAQGKALNLTKPNYISGAFTPYLYDYETFVRNLPQASYIKIGKLVVMFAMYDSIDISGISTMMQIRNVPCNAIYGGSIYFGQLPDNGGQLVIQPSQYGVYIRPNIKTSDFPRGISGPVGFMFYGLDE